MSSVVDLSVEELEPELEAALLGDFPSLRRGSDTARRFADSFGPSPGRSRSNEDVPATPLGVAASAVSFERAGNLEIALRGYQEVADLDGWPALLGLLLLGWTSASDDLAPVGRAHEIVRQLSSGRLKSHLLAKIATFALDKRDGDLARSVWQEAIDAAPEKSLLRRALQIEGFNLGFPRDSAAQDISSDQASDPLVTLPWLDSLRLAAASGALVKEVESQSQGAWTVTMGFGQSPLDEVVAAEVQATWAGALWVRREIRKQLGAQLLTGAASTPQQWAYGVLMWALGGQHNPERVIPMAEPYLDHGGADFIVSSLAESADSGFYQQRFVMVAADLWDLLTDDMLRAVISRVEPELGDAWHAPATRRIWAAYALRLQAEWADAYSRLSPDLRGALLDHLSPNAVRHFDADTRATILASAVEYAKVSDGDATLPLIASLAGQGDREIAELVDAQASDVIVAAIADLRADVVFPATADRVVRSLSEQVLRDSAEARKGTVGFGAGTRIALGRLLAAMPEVTQDQIEPLLATALAEDLPPEYVLEARQGLTLLRQTHPMDAATIERLHSGNDRVGSGLTHGGMTEDLLKVSRLRVLASSTSHDEQLALVAATRDSDARVREVAISACVETLEDGADQALVWAIVSGLFDPSEGVMSAALDGLPAVTRESRAAAVVSWDRLPRLLELAGRDVRVAAIHAAHAAAQSDTGYDERLRRLVARAQHDKSWRVRDAAASPPESQVAGSS